MYCGNCGTKIENTQYCGECGTKSQGYKAPEQQVQTPPPAGGAAIQTILFIVAIITALYGLFAISIS